MRYRIGQCTPLVFLEASSDPQATALRYTQRFSIYDHIVVQFAADESHNVYVGWYKASNDGYVANKLMTRVSMGGGWYMYTASLPVLPVGVYRIKMAYGGNPVFATTTDFEVVNDDLLTDTMLIEYSNTDNDTPMDNIFVVSGVRQVLRLRIEGGFKPQGYTANVAQETWRTQYQELRQLYSAPYDKWALTIGSAQGVPVEYIRIINAILSCNIVYINGRRWCRSEGSVPEKQLTMQGAQMFTASVDVERQIMLEDYPTELYAGNGDYNGDYNNDYDK